MKLEAKVHFFASKRLFWPELLIGSAEAARITDDDLSQRCVDAIDNWIMQPAVLLARHGLPYSAGPTLRKDAINIVSGLDFPIRSRDIDSFVLAMRADGPLPCIANFVGEQNRLSLPREGAAYFAHLPQPGLVPRDPSRGTRLESISFKGGEINLAEPFRSPTFREKLAERGISLRLDLFRPGEKTKITMHDYRDVDAVVAVRNLTIGDYRAKPASKLVNCWLAGVPAILGPEPAFRELRQGPLDYLEVRTPDDALAALDRLRSDPGLYTAMVENGRKRALQHTQTATLAAWIEAIDGPVQQSFERWQATSRAYRLARWPLAAMRQKAAKRRARNVRQSGPRGPGEP
jgi:hypothetical protein